MTDPNQERLKQLLKKLAETQMGRSEQNNDWEQTFEKLVETRFEAEEIRTTDEMDVKVLARLHDELQNLKAPAPATHLNGRVSEAIRSKLQAFARPRRPLARRLAWISGAVGVALLGVVWYALTPARLVEIGVFTSIKGGPKVSRAGAGSMTLASTTTRLYDGSRIETGAGDSAEFRFKDGTTLNLGINSAIQIANVTGSEPRPEEIKLLRGRVRAKVVRGAKPRRFVVSTPFATAEALGTEFSVEVREHPGKKAEEAVLVVLSGRVNFFNKLGSVEATARTICIARAGFAPSLPRPRHSYASTSVNGILYAIGGGSHGTSSAIADVEAYDPSSDTWTGLASMHVARQQLAAVVINGIIYAVGGCTAQEPLDALEAYDPATNTWTSKAPMPTARTGASAGAVGNKLYVLGGAHGFEPQTYSDLVEAYDPATNSWSRRASMPTGRSGIGVGVVDGKLYAVGGEVRGGRDSRGWRTTSTVEVYDPRINTWSSRAPMPTPRSWPTLAYIGGILYAMGGYDLKGRSLNTVEAYDPKANVWITLPPMPVAFTASYIGAAVHDGTVYIAGRVPDLEMSHDDSGPRVFQGNIGVASMTPSGWDYSDGDGLTNAEERELYHTDVANPDTDGDGLSDGIELMYGTDPTKADTDDDGVMDWEDPTPLVRGATGSRIVDALRDLEARVRRLPLSHFLIHSISERGARQRRELLADKLAWAANMVASGDRKRAMEWLLLQAPQADPGIYAMGWMANGEEKAAIATEMQMLSVLLRPR